MWIMKKTSLLLTTKSILIVTLILASQIVLSEDSDSCPNKNLKLVDGNLCVSEPILANNPFMAKKECEEIGALICSEENWRDVFCKNKIPDWTENKSFWLKISTSATLGKISKDCVPLTSDTNNTEASHVLCCLAPLPKKIPTFPLDPTTTTTTTIPKSNTNTNFIKKRGVTK